MCWNLVGIQAGNYPTCCKQKGSTLPVTPYDVLRAAKGLTPISLPFLTSQLLLPLNQYIIGHLFTGTIIMVIFGLSRFLSETGLPLAKK